MTTLSHSCLQTHCNVFDENYQCGDMRLRIILPTLLLLQFAQADTQQLRTTVDQWVSVMEKLHAEKSRWAREKEVLASSKEGLMYEISDLKQSISDLEESAKAASIEDQDKIDLKRGYDDARESLALGVDGLMKRVPELFSLVPASYLADNTKLQSAQQAFKDLKDAEEGKEIGAKLNLVVSVLGELESFNQKMWTVSETHKVGDKDYIMTTVYLGLGAAYSADEKATVALVGRPSPAGWIFSEIEDPSAAKEINKLIITNTGAGELEFSKLPVEIK